MVRSAIPGTLKASDTGQELGMEPSKPEQCPRCGLYACPYHYTLNWQLAQPIDERRRVYDPHEIGHTTTSDGEQW